MKNKCVFILGCTLGCILAFNITTLNPYGEIMKEHNNPNHHHHQPNKPHCPPKPNPSDPSKPHNPHQKPGCGC
ncbi:MAG: hypothetical protein QG627_1154 [Chlamydiota bacterium]|jgi:hypothetical protein|nr:hypothetical protein [Chlamydiota bacterium]